VPYLSVMTKIEERPYDDLLLKKGFGGFPTLAFMDAEGEVLAQPTDRSVQAFVACREALAVVDDVSARAAAGDAEAQAELLLLDNVLGRVKGEEFAKRAQAVRAGANAEQLARIDQALVDNEVMDLVQQTYRGDAEAACVRMLAILDGGKHPSKTSRHAGGLWSALARWAEPKGDAALLRRIAAGMRADLPDDERLSKRAQSLEEKATGLDTRDALVARRDKGEGGLEAQILVIEVRLRALSLAELRERLPAALAVATEAEKQELAQGEVDMQFSSLVNEFWGGGNREEIGQTMFDLLSGDGLAPSAQEAPTTWTCLSVWASSSKDPARMDAVVKVLRARFAASGRIERTLKHLEDEAEKLRDDT